MTGGVTNTEAHQVLRSRLVGRRVHYVSLDFWPDRYGIAPYATQLAEHLAAIGAEVVASTGMPHYPSWRIDPRYRWRFRSRESHVGVTVRRLRHFVPARQTALRRATYEGTFLAQALTQPPPWRPDLVVAVVPSLGGGLAAAVHARRYQAPLAVFVQDLLGAAAAQSGVSGGSTVAKATTRAEMWLLRQADAVIALNDAFASQAVAAGVPRDRCVVLPNWSHQPDPVAPRHVARARMGWGEDTTVVLHTGNMGFKQDLANVVEAARLAHEQGQPVLFVLMGDGHQRPALEAAGRGLPTLQFCDGIFGQDYVDVLAAADVLLVNEKDTVVDMSLPSKLTSYFCAGRPVLAAVVAAGTTAAQLRCSGGGVVIPPATPQRLLNDAMALAGDKQLSHQLGTAGRHFAATELSKEYLLRRFEEILGDTMAASR